MRLSWVFFLGWIKHPCVPTVIPGQTEGLKGPLLGTLSHEPKFKRPYVQLTSPDRQKGWRVGAEGWRIQGGEYRFSSLMKQKLQGKNCAFFCFAGKNFFSSLMKQKIKGKNCAFFCFAGKRIFFFIFMMWLHGEKEKKALLLSSCDSCRVVLIGRSGSCRRSGSCTLFATRLKLE